MRASIIVIMLAAVISGGCASVLTIDSQNYTPVIDGQTDEWTELDFTGFEQTGIYSASFYDDSTVYLCMKLLKRDDIMKTMSGGAEFSYNNNIINNTCILMPLHEKNVSGPRPEHMHGNSDGPPEDKSFQFTGINTDALSRNVEAYFSFNEGIGTFEMSIPTVLEDTPLTITMLLSSVDQKGMPQSGKPPEGVGGKVPPGGGYMNRPMGNDNQNNNMQNDNDRDSDKEISIKIVKADILKTQ